MGKKKNRWSLAPALGLLLLSLATGCGDDEKDEWQTFPGKWEDAEHLPHYPVSITGGSDQVCTASTFSVSYPNSTVTWSCTGPLRITSQSNTSCTVSSTGNGNSDTWCTSHSGNYFSIESDYDLNSYEVRLKTYPYPTFEAAATSSLSS